MGSYKGEKATGVPVPSNEHLKEVCRHGQGAQACKFLAVGGLRPLCMKSNAKYKLAHFYRKSDQKIFPNDPQADNCSGGPDFMEHAEAKRFKPQRQQGANETTETDLLSTLSLAYPREDGEV